jgi:hypothetical protein
MELDWHAIDRWVMGEAWTGSRIKEHLVELCDNIGPRWSSSEAEGQTINYIKDRMQADGLKSAGLEEFQLETWSWDRAEAWAMPGDTPVDILPFNRCPSVSIQAPLVDVGYGTPREIEAAGNGLSGAIAVMSLAYEPFTTPIPHAKRLTALAEKGASAAVVVEVKDGRRMEYHSASDWRNPDLNEHPLPTVVTSREHGALLRRLATHDKSLKLVVESRFYTAPSANVTAEITGTRWPGEHLILGGHHDTVYGSPGGNDNATGIIAIMEVARVLTELQNETGQAPGRSIRFVTFGAEEQKFQGAFDYVNRHYGQETPPRLAINLDELSTGSIKGFVLGFPHLRGLVQRQFDTMDDGLKCHVMSQIDPTSDHYPFLRAGFDAAHIWRWRFHGRHGDANFHHEPGDTFDKVNTRELKEYIGQLARILLRLSHVPPDEWPKNPVTPDQVRDRLNEERGTVVRLF